MRDVEYQEAIKTYDLRTLLAARQRLAEDQFEGRAASLDAEIARREAGIPPESPPNPSRLNVSREEGYAGFIYRVPALILDLLLIYLPLGLLFETLLGMNLIAWVCALPFAYPLYVIVCTARWGKTLGKMLLGLVVVNTEGSLPSLAQSVRRHVPDLVFAALMSASLALALLNGMSLPEHGTTVARVSSFHFQLPMWDALDDLWDLWIWSEILLLCLDAKRRSLHEFLSRTLVVHSNQRDRIDFDEAGEASWYDWLARTLLKLHLRSKGA